MIVPEVFFIENRQPQAAIVYFADDHIAVLLRYGFSFRRQIYHFKRRIADGFVFIKFENNFVVKAINLMLKPNKLL